MNSIATDTEFPNDRADQFVALMVRQRHAVHAFVSKQVISAREVEEILQRTTTLLWESTSEFKGKEGEFARWACDVALRETGCVLNRKEHVAQHFDDELRQLIAKEAEPEFELSDMRLSVLKECVDALPVEYQSLLRRCYADASNWAEIASRLKRDRGTLVRQVSKVNKRLWLSMRARCKEVGMARECFSPALNQVISGELAEDAQAAMNAELKSNPGLRRSLRDRMDLEACLRTWAQEHSRQEIMAGVALDHLVDYHRSFSQLFLVAALMLLVATPIAIGVWMERFSDADIPSSGEPTVELVSSGR